MAVVWPGVGAVERSMHHIALGPRAHTVRQCHSGEAVYYVKSGAGAVLDSRQRHQRRHRRGLDGPCRAWYGIPILGRRRRHGAARRALPPDPSLYAHL
ncbi:MAG: hypothetical protein WDO24_22865 [Pseudomonadota bacterium]